MFRQAVSDSDENKDILHNHYKPTTGDSSAPPLVDNTLLADRYVLSGTQLILTREIRYKYSKNKFRPGSNKDVLSPTDPEKKPYIEPTKELAFVNNLIDGGFYVLQLPTKNNDVRKWQIFHYDNVSHKLISHNVKAAKDGWFDTSDSKDYINAFIQKYVKIKWVDGNVSIPEQKAGKAKMLTKKEIEEKVLLYIPEWLSLDLNEFGDSEFYDFVSQDGKTTGKYLEDFLYDESGISYTILKKEIYPLFTCSKNEFLELMHIFRIGLVKDEYTIKNGSGHDCKVDKGIAATLFYQDEEVEEEGQKKVIRRPSLLLALGVKYLRDGNPHHYIGTINFSVSDQGALSRITENNIMLKKIDMAAADQEDIKNKISELEEEISKWEVERRRLIEDLREAMKKAKVKSIHIDDLPSDQVSTIWSKYKDDLDQAIAYKDYFIPSDSNPKINVKDADYINKKNDFINFFGWCYKAFEDGSVDEIIKQRLEISESSQRGMIQRGMLDDAEHEALYSWDRDLQNLKESGNYETDRSKCKERMNSLLISKYAPFNDAFSKLPSQANAFTYNRGVKAIYLIRTMQASLYRLPEKKEINYDFKFKNRESAFFAYFTIGHDIFTQEEADNTLYLSDYGILIATYSYLWLNTIIHEKKPILENLRNQQNTSGYSLPMHPIETATETTTGGMLDFGDSDNVTKPFLHEDANGKVGLYFQNNEHKFSALYFHPSKEQGKYGNWTPAETGKAISIPDKGTALANHPDDWGKLKQFQYSKKGLAMEAWVNPTTLTKEEAYSVIYFYNEAGNTGLRNFQLGISATSKSAYNVFAHYGDYLIKSQRDYPVNQWRHLALSCYQHWGLSLQKGTYINCGNDISLSSDGDFSIEIALQLTSLDNAVILVKDFEYRILIEDKKLVFAYFQNGWQKVQSNVVLKKGEYQKITIVKSKDKPTKEVNPALMVQPNTSSMGTESDSEIDDMDEDGMKSYIKSEKRKLNDTLKSFTPEGAGTAASNKQMVDDKYYLSFYVIDDKDQLADKKTITDDVKILPPENIHQELKIGGSDFAGVIDEIRIWNRALAESEAVKNKISKTKSGLAAHYRLAEGEGYILFDQTGTNDAIIKGSDFGWKDSPNTTVKRFTLYVDGESQAIEVSKDTQQDETYDHLCISGYFPKTNNKTIKSAFCGKLEEIRIWNQPRSEEEISDNAFGRLKGERDKLLANYTFDRNKIKDDKDWLLDDGPLGIDLWIQKENEENENACQMIYSDAPISDEIPIIRSAVGEVDTLYHDTIDATPALVEYGDVQHQIDGTLKGVLKKCYAFIKDNSVHLVTGYKVGNLVTQWYCQAQFDPQVMGFIEGAPPVPGENFPVNSDSDMNIYSYRLDNSVEFVQAEEVSYNYSTSKEIGMDAASIANNSTGVGMDAVLAPLGIGISIEGSLALDINTNFSQNINRSQSFSKGLGRNTNKSLKVGLAGYKKAINGKDYMGMGNTGYALVKSKTADVYLLKLEHNNAVISTVWIPNEDIPEDVNIIPFPMNPLYVKQGTLDGNFGKGADESYQNSSGTNSEKSYFKPKEAYKLKHRIEKEQLQMEQLFQQMDVEDKSGAYSKREAIASLTQLVGILPGWATMMILSAANQVIGSLNDSVYAEIDLKKELSKIKSKKNIANTYVWTIYGGFYAESIQQVESVQEVFNSNCSFTVGSEHGYSLGFDMTVSVDHKFGMSRDHSLAVTRTKTKESNSSWEVNVNVDLPTSPRYKRKGLELTKGNLIDPGTVDAYRFMTFYLEPGPENYDELFSKVVDPIWLNNNPSDPYVIALKQAMNAEKRPHCWRIMHRVTYVSRIPKKDGEVGTIEHKMKLNNIESNYLLIKTLEPHVDQDSNNVADFESQVREAIKQHLPEFVEFEQEIIEYMKNYYGIY